MIVDIGSGDPELHFEVLFHFVGLEFVKHRFRGVDSHGGYALLAGMKLNRFGKTIHKKQTADFGDSARSLVAVAADVGKVRIKDLTPVGSGFFTALGPGNIPRAESQKNKSRPYDCASQYLLFHHILP